ncbi:hypothetical protein B0H14DRAFT_3084187 [Mycena olivaceomarginata]|nr:hypothetical protein B0H14DRAFT_3084187 [Mycena olivaceomarginata]
MYLSEMLRHEGRGDHDYTTCPRCAQGKPDHRCKDCMGGGELLCESCMLNGHRQLPFHRIEQWKGSSFTPRTLKDMGLRIQLGHWKPNDRACSVPHPAPNDDFVIVHENGVHPVHLDYCGCGRGGLRTVQLLRARLWAATTTHPRTAATFSVLRSYHLHSFESKCAALEFYQALARQTDNLHHKKEKDRYQEFMRMTRQWRNVQMLKRAGRGHEADGVAKTAMGECALLCPACPQPGKNLPPGNANFRLKRKDVSSEEKDSGLGNGWAFFCEVQAYMAHVKKHWDFKQDVCDFPAGRALDKPDREARGTASSGVGAVDCARHNMKRPNAVGDLQLGERYINMDYIFFCSIAGSPLMRFFVSYDIACQWHINIWRQMRHYQDDTLTIDGTGKFMTFLVPKFHLPAHIEACNLKFSFHLTRDVGQTDGEAPERGWADANPLARSTKEMGPGFRRDTMDDHFNDWNHKKIIALGYMMRRKVEKAVAEMTRTREALADMEESLGPGPVGEWTTMAETWEADITAPNPFETIRKDQHLAKVRAELAAEAAAREAEGKEDAGAVKGDMHITELIAMGLQLEDQQYVHTTGHERALTMRRAMIERTSKLRRKIVAWAEVQQKFFPALANVRQREDEERARTSAGQSVPGLRVSDMALWLPSAVAAAPGPDVEGVTIGRAVQEHEYRLRVGQANEALHEVRRLLLVRTHLYKLKDTHSRGVRANMRSGDKIAALNQQVRRAAAQYRAARTALEALGRVLNKKEWEWTLWPLREDDIRGLPQLHFHDPQRKKKKRARVKKRVEREISWIWVNRGEGWEPGDDVAMNEAVRIEWAKTRARSMRWAEEVDLLEEEMRRIRQFLVWREEWWKAKVDRRGLPEGPQREGETAYALRQAGIQAALAKDFATDDEEGSDKSGMGSSGEEDEPIPSLPQRTVKPTYVDEVLVM